MVLIIKRLQCPGKRTNNLWLWPCFLPCFFLMYKGGLSDFTWKRCFFFLLDFFITRNLSVVCPGSLSRWLKNWGVYSNADSPEDKCATLICVQVNALSSHLSQTPPKQLREKQSSWKSPCFWIPLPYHLSWAASWFLRGNLQQNREDKMWTSCYFLN